MKKEILIKVSYDELLVAYQNKTLDRYLLEKVKTPIKEHNPKRGTKKRVNIWR